MTAMTNYTENQLGDHIFRTASFPKPTQLNYELYTAAPGEAGGGTKVTGGAYAAVNLPPLDANYNGTHGNTTGASSGSSGLIDNAVAITFPAPVGAAWGLITHMGIEDQSGNLLTYGALTASKTVNDGDPAPSFPIGDADFTFA